MFRRPGDRIPDLTESEAEAERKSAKPSFSPATQEAVTPRHVFTELQALKQELRVAYLPEFDVMGPYTIGGTPAAASQAAYYRLDSPFTTTCEYALLAVTQDTNVASVSLSHNQNAVTPAPAAGAVFSQGSAVNGIYLLLDGSNPLAFPVIWYPLPANGSLYLAVNSANASSLVYAVIVFRRKRDKQAVYYE